MLGNSMFNRWKRYMRNIAILILAAAGLVSLLYSTVLGPGGLILFLVFVAVIPLIIFPPYMPMTVTLSEDRLHLNYQRPLKDVTVRWTLVSVIKVWRRRRRFLMPEFCTLTFLDENGNKVRPPLFLHVSTDVTDEIESFLEASDYGVAVKREKASWWIDGWGWGDD